MEGSRRISSRLRKKRGDVIEEEGETGRVVKETHCDTPPSVSKWEWQNDGGWTAFDAGHSAAIATAFKANAPEVVVKIAAAKMELRVVFASMTQTNATTGWQRSIRCISDSTDTAGPGGSGDGCGKWAWRDGDGKWTLYPAAVCRLLDACKLCGVMEREIISHDRKYRVELGIGTQGWSQVNVDTHVRSEVRCQKVGGAISGGVGAIGVHSASDNDDSATSGNGVSQAKVGVASNMNSRRGKTSEAKGEVGGVTQVKDLARKKVQATESDALVALTGKAPVDRKCREKVGKACVWGDELGQLWDATLNQTNLTNNNNKFYILQLLRDNSSSNYSVWFRWGRVGKVGQSLLTACGSDLDHAKQLFTKKFLDKTCNHWADSTSFVKHQGKYDLISMDYEVTEEEDAGREDKGGVAGGEDTKPEQQHCTLDGRLQNLVELVCDVQTMEDTVLEMKYDVKKAPLGKLTPEQVSSGYAALKKVEECINRNCFGDSLVRACNDFYTRIPHCFGMKRPPVIRTKEEVKEKVALLETLSDIQIALKVLQEGDRREHPMDRHYHSLNCTLSPVDHEDAVFSMVTKYVKNTHARTHNQYQLEVVEVFQVNKEREVGVFKDVGNRTLLWHGSRLPNWVGILSQGLRIAPPEAPPTGYMFGKGIYFSDMCSKSANYCFASRNKSEGLVLLCDVSLGKCQELLAADYSADKLLKGKHSTKGLGSVAPDPSQSHTQSDGCLVPLGTAVDTGVWNASGYTLNYNEFIVYDPKQVKMKYLIRLKFHFK